MGLKEYQKKRQFKSSPEPKGQATKAKVGKASKLRFVVQKHAASRLHYDFRLEVDGVLKSWAVPKGPSLNPLDQHLAIEVEDHPIEYGSFEGTIPKGNYGAGTVMLWDKGTYVHRQSKTSSDSESLMKKSLADGKLTFVLKGKKLNGEFALVKLKHSREKNAWLLLKKRDAMAKFRPADTKTEDRSVKSGRTMDEITTKSKKTWGKKKEFTEEPKLLSKKISRIPTLSASERPPLTNLKKIFWPKEGYTKGDLIAYYDSIADVILPHLKDRPQSLHRQPNGLKDGGFFQKDMVGFVPRRVETLRIYSESVKKTINYSLVQDKWSLLYLINLGCIELNPWLSRKPTLDKPDYVVIDLDPDDNAFSEVIDVAKAFHKLLTTLKIKAWCKTSGSTGLHICIPTCHRYGYDEVREFAEILCQVIHHQMPKNTSIERNPARRRGKIYLDFLQNRRGQTLAAPYCVRPRLKATVSTPLKWTELKKGLKPELFTILNTKKRIDKLGDLWPQPDAAKLNLKASLAQLLKIQHKLTRC